MKKTYRLENLECAHCAALMEHAILKIPGVQSATISFMTQKLIIEADEDEHDTIRPLAEAAVRRIERSCKIV